MAKERIMHGLGPVEFGEPTGTDTMPSVMSPAFRTYRDSVTLSEDDAEITEEYSDQDDQAIINLITAGAKNVKGSTFDYSNETLTLLKGGTVLNGQWVEPATAPIIIKAVRLTTADGTPLECPRMQIFSKFNMELKKKNVALLEFTFKPLAPFRFGTKS